MCSAVWAPVALTGNSTEHRRHSEELVGPWTIQSRAFCIHPQAGSLGKEAGVAGRTQALEWDRA